MNIQRIDTRDADIARHLDALRAKLSPRGDIVSEAGRQKTLEVFGEPLTPVDVVDRICRAVRDEGLAALLRYTRQLDGAALTAETLRVSQQELEAAHRAAAPEFLDTIRRVRANIAEFQSAILHRDVEVRQTNGMVLRQRYLPLHRAGICIPGGMAAYPSTVLMTAVPAQAAGVEQLAVVAPPTPFGANNPDLLATCHELGIRELYRVGGAQAVAALAFGVDGLPAVDKIVGPGNLFVALAKKHVYGEVDIDAIAGPSEVIVLADETTRPEFAAADLLAQAEHAPGASVLICWHAPTLEAIADELARQVAQLPRHDVTVQSLSNFGALILAQNAEEACAITDMMAPEHLHIAIDDPWPLLPRIRHAGATFLGQYAPVAVGDYVAGPSHVLPTGGTARWASGLSSNDFLRSSSVIECSAAALAAVAVDLQRLADKEQLSAHRASVDIRLSSIESSP